MFSGRYKTRKEEYIEIAQQLGYRNETIRKLEKATSDEQCERILHEARVNSD